MDAYPKRPPFFSHRFVRLMAKVCLANEIGAETCWMLAVIAHTEDASGYRRAVTFFNEQLYPLVGVGSVDSLARIRAKAVAAGWLNYEPGAKHKAGRYFVMIPPRAEGLDDGVTSEVEGEYTEDTSAKTRKQPRSNREESAEATAKQPRGKCGTFFPVPNPDPNEDPLTPETGDHRAVVLEPSEFLTAWNAVPQFVHARGLTGKRLRHFRARARDDDWSRNWRDALTRAARLPFCLGRNDRGWRATVDWFLRPDTVTKILEGCYDSLTKGPAPKPAETEQQRKDRIRREKEANERSMPSAADTEAARRRLLESIGKMPE